MKVFLDTNILLEYFCNRDQADIVEKILRFIKEELLTLNYNDFRNAAGEDIIILTPQQFVSLYMK